MESVSLSSFSKILDSSFRLANFLFPFPSSSLSFLAFFFCSQAELREKSKKNHTIFVSFSTIPLHSGSTPFTVVGFHFQLFGFPLDLLLRFSFLFPRNCPGFRSLRGFLGCLTVLGTYFFSCYKNFQDIFCNFGKVGLF